MADLALWRDRQTLTADDLALVKRTVAVGATDDELKLYLYDCERLGIHPLDKLLHFTKRGGRYTPITSIDLMRARAHDTGECLGISDAVFSGKAAAESFAATVTVKRLVKGLIAEFTATARWPEYYPGEGGIGAMWRKMPHVMLSKCAEALALRKAFPRQLSGLYERAELDQADVLEPPMRVARPAPASPPSAEVEPPAVSSPAPEGILHPAADQGALPEGVFFIERVSEPISTQNATVFRHHVLFSDGQTFTTINEQLAALAEQICQEGVPCRRLIEKKHKGLVDLVGLKRYEPETTASVAIPGELTAVDIPF